MTRTALLAAAMTAAFMTFAARAADEPATTTEPADTSAMPAPVDGVDTNAPLEGENSFTEAQVTDMLTELGFTAISGLMLDEKGIWRAQATHDGKEGPVAVDYRGNVVFDGVLVPKPE
ncbi:MAG: hypothetical protein QM698_08185 [Micropepsaceae bacterium]